jgi:hypothetical protein
MTTQVYEIKIGRKWNKVRATSMAALNAYCKENNIPDWRMVGMMSRAEIKESESFKVVA